MLELITSIDIVRRSEQDYPSFVGFASFVFCDSFCIDGVGVHCRDGQFSLAFPRSSRGRSVAFPTNDETRRVLTNKIAEVYNSNVLHWKNLKEKTK